MTPISNLVRSEVTAECTVSHSAHLVISCTISTLSINALFASHDMQGHYKSSCKNAGIVLSSHCMQELYPAYASMQGRCSPSHARAVLNSCMLSLYHMQGLYWTHDMQRQHLALVTCTS